MSRRQSARSARRRAALLPSAMPKPPGPGSYLARYDRSLPCLCRENPAACPRCVLHVTWLLLADHSSLRP